VAFAEIGLDRDEYTDEAFATTSAEASERHIAQVSRVFELRDNEK
jgi:hypothetical protein